MQSFRFALFGALQYDVLWFETVHTWAQNMTATSLYLWEYKRQRIKGFRSCVHFSLGRSRVMSHYAPVHSGIMNDDTFRRQSNATFSLLPSGTPLWHSCMPFLVLLECHWRALSTVCALQWTLHTMSRCTMEYTGHVIVGRIGCTGNLWLGCGWNAWHQGHCCHKNVLYNNSGQHTSQFKRSFAFVHGVLPGGFHRWLEQVHTNDCNMF